MLAGVAGMLVLATLGMAVTTPFRDRTFPG
jgi:hypothetical protein